MKAKNILVVVDYQNDFVDGTLGFAEASKLDIGIATKIRRYGLGNVLCTMDTHTSDYLSSREGLALPIEHCISGTIGYNIYGETAKALEDVESLILEKITFGVSPFQMIELIQEYSQVETIEIVGVVTNICVLSNVIVFQAAFPEAQIIVDAALCDSFDQALHEKTLDVLEGLQVEVINR